MKNLNIPFFELSSFNIVSFLYLNFNSPFSIKWKVFPNWTPYDILLLDCIKYGFPLINFLPSLVWKFEQ